MTNFTDICGLTGVAAAMAVLLTLFIQNSFCRSGCIVKGNAGRIWQALLVIFFLLMVIPLNGLPMAAFIRGMTGDLSITTLVLLGNWWTKSCCNYEISGSTERLYLLIGISIASLLLYPMALGATPFDPYRLGYGNLIFVSAILLVSGYAWHKTSSLIVINLSLAVFAWGGRWYESDNLWDYLLDPFVSIYALSATAIFIVKALRKRT